MYHLKVVQHGKEVRQRNGMVGGAHGCIRGSDSQQGVCLWPPLMAAAARAPATLQLRLHAASEAVGRGVCHQGRVRRGHRTLQCALTGQGAA